MAQTCWQCSRPSPPEAVYCYWDGVRLSGTAAPLVAGSQPFASPFCWPSGQRSHDFDELALACWTDWPAARQALTQGEFAAFLGRLGRADLAQAARAAAERPDLDCALDALLDSLPSRVLQPPQLQVEPAQLDLGTLRVGQDRCLELRLANLGQRLLHGTLTFTGGVWLALGDPAGHQQKVIQCHRELAVDLHVRGDRLSSSSQPLEGRLEIVTNGGQAAIPVRGRVPVQPFPAGPLAGALSPRQVAEKARAQPVAAAAFFANGAVARWYHANGWRYPVPGAASTGLGAVQQFFEALGLARPPRVRISQQQVALQGSPGGILRHRLEVATTENRSVYALASSNQPWLLIETPVPQGRSAPLNLVVPAVPDCPGKTLTAQVRVCANGNQRFVVDVTLTVGSGASSTDDIILLRPVAPPARPTVLPTPALARPGRGVRSP